MKTIFVSSTFQDMHFERDILQQKVLPRLQEFAKKYGETVELCDLRWGVDTTGMNEEQSASKILQTCFDEIDRSHPLFLGLLGNRYGWVPDESQVHSILESQDRKISESGQKSVTELEILYNIKKRDINGSMAKYYFRTITNAKPGFFRKSFVPQIYLSESRQDEQRIQYLKDRIQKEFPQRVSMYSVTWDPKAQTFCGLDTFEEMVYEDLRSMLASQFTCSTEPSETERQERQMLYAFESDHYFRGGKPIPLQLNQIAREKLLHGTWVHEKQNVFFCGVDPYQLDYLAASMLFLYHDQGWNIIPYDCGLSIFTRSMQHMLVYLADITGKSAGIVTEKSEDASNNIAESLNRLRTGWISSLGELDRKGTKTLILVRGLEKLDALDPLWWLPAEQFKNIRFMVFGEKMPVGSKIFKEMTEVFYFQSIDVFEREDYLDAYMDYFHKQLNEKVKLDILAASENKHPQYMEFLMQRLLVLNKNDFEEIKRYGNGIEAISHHLERLVTEAPGNLEDMVLEKKAFLQEEIGKDDSDYLMGMLLSAPYGISERILIRIAERNRRTLTHLSVSMFCRILGPLINETENGNLRIVPSPAASILQDTMIVEVSQASSFLVSAMEDMMKRQSDLEAGWQELIGTQYLCAAFRIEREGALNRYLDYMIEDSEQAMMAIRALQKIPGGAYWLESEAGRISKESIKFCIFSLFCRFDENSYLDKAVFQMWKPIAKSAELLLNNDPSHENMKTVFFICFQCGKIAHQQNDPETEIYLIRAKQIAKEDFDRYHNRIWRTVHGIELTPEEKQHDAEFLKSVGIEESGADLQFSYGTEVQDMLTEQSWTDHVRIINSYLEQIYHESGNAVKAQELQKEVEEMTRMLDPVIQSGKGEIAAGVEIIYPDDGSDSVSVRYKPDYRRNSAIQLSKEAIRLKREEKHQEALTKYEESNKILLQIYEDGKSGDNYDMNGVFDAENQARRIQTECIRDLAINYQGMVSCDLAIGTITDMEVHVEKMLEYGLMFDTARNSCESKKDLADYYIVAISVYSMSDASGLTEKILDTAGKFYQYYEDAFSKGHQKGNYEKHRRDSVNQLIYDSLTTSPELGTIGVDLILKVNNDAVMVQDFENFCTLAGLMSDLIDWAQEHDVYWHGTQISLEDLYIKTVQNLCFLWKQNEMWDNLKYDAGRLERQMPGLKGNKSVIDASEIVSDVVSRCFQEGEYEEAARISQNIMAQLQRVPYDEYPVLTGVHHQSRLVTALSEAGRLDEAEKAVTELEETIKKALHTGYTWIDKKWGISPEKHRSALLTELCIGYLNHAIIMSRQGKTEKGMILLEYVGELLEKEPWIGSTKPGLKQRLDYFRKKGLPTPNEPRNKEIRYRELENKLDDTLRQLQTKLHNMTESTVDLFAGSLDELEEIHQEGLFGTDSEIAWYYFKLYQLYKYVNARKKAAEALSRAKDIVDRDGEVLAFYGMIYNDYTVYCHSNSERMEYTQKAITIYETLRKRGEKYSLNDLAMAIRNRGLLYANEGEWVMAEKDVTRAILIWKEIQKEYDSEDIREMLKDAQRLLSHIQQNINR